MYSIKFYKTLFAFAQILILHLLFGNRMQMYAQGGTTENDIPLIITYQSAENSLSEITSFQLLEDVSFKIRKITIEANLSEAFVGDLSLEIQLSQKQLLGDGVATNYAINGEQVLIQINMPDPVQLHAGELLTLLSDQPGHITPVALHMQTTDGIVVTVNIDDFKKAAPYPMLLLNISGETVATYDLYSLGEFAMALCLLSPGLYISFDPKGIQLPKKYLKQ